MSDLKIYLISRIDTDHSNRIAYDQNYAHVVIARDENQVRVLAADEADEEWTKERPNIWFECAKVTYLGIAEESFTAEVILTDSWS